MIRSTIKINDYTFLCDLYLYDECVDKHRKSFYLLRNIYIDNNSGNIYDNDIYIVDSDLVNIVNDELCLSDDIILPVPGSMLQFTTNVNKFCEVTNPTLYALLSKDNKELKLIECHKVRLYHPNTKYIGNSIIYVDNMINDVHFHYFCRKYSDLKNNAETEIREANTYYSEYVEFYLPNLIDLLSTDTVYIDDIIEYDNTEIDIDNDNIYTPLYNYNLPYIADENKRYIINSYNDSGIAYSKYPYNITLYPFTFLNDDDIFYNTSDLVPNSDIIIAENKLDFCASLSFHNDDENTNETEDLRDGELIIKTKFSFRNQTENIFEIYKKLNNIDKTYSETTYPCMYILALASDPEFKNIITRQSLPVVYDFENLFDDFANYLDYMPEDTTEFPGFGSQEFSIPVYDSWSQLPEILLYRVYFYDLHLGVKICSNIGIISKEKYKYLVNLNTGIKRHQYKINLKDIKDMKFVDKITCVIKKNTDESQNIAFNSAPKIIYKPIFYRTQDLQNIKIQRNVTQNIGVNLLTYLSKVETFYITIDDKQFIETGRNDVYVIFSVQANLLTTNGGSYHISNQDNEYISSGSWSLV